MSDGISKEVRALIHDARGWEFDEESFLDALGGTWDVEHTHVFPRPAPIGADRVLECAEGCEFQAGVHVRRHRWRGEPLPPA